MCGKLEPIHSIDYTPIHTIMYIHLIILWHLLSYTIFEINVHTHACRDCVLRLLANRLGYTDQPGQQIAINRASSETLNLTLHIHTGEYTHVYTHITS